jgi:hypothetical protein
VLIAPVDFQEGVKTRAAACVDGELLTFTHLEARPALQAILSRRPKTIVLERLFAATPRGAALITRIKADSALDDCEIRVLAHDSDYSRVVPRPNKAPAAQPPLDHTGTRRAPRFKIAPKIDAIVDKARAALIDLSTLGAQVVSPAALKPDQRVRVGLEDLEFDATVAWVALTVLETGATRYRAGLEFLGAKAEDVDAFIARHKA